MIVLSILTTSPLRFSLKSWENVLFQLGSARVKMWIAHIKQGITRLHYFTEGNSPFAKSLSLVGDRQTDRQTDRQAGEYSGAHRCQSISSFLFSYSTDRTLFSFSPPHLSPNCYRLAFFNSATGAMHTKYRNIHTERVGFTIKAFA